MGRIRHARLWAAAAAVIGACAITAAGCGGGDDTSTSAAARTVPQVTTPGQFRPGGDSTSTAPSTPGTTTAPSAPNNPPGAQPVAQALAPFRDCLRQHGVDLPLLDNPGALRQRYQRDPEGFRAQIEKGFACIPELPPRMRAYAERFKRRFEQRNG